MFFLLKTSKYLTVLNIFSLGPQICTVCSCSWEWILSGSSSGGPNSCMNLIAMETKSPWLTLSPRWCGEQPSMMSLIRWGRETEQQSIISIWFTLIDFIQEKKRWEINVLVCSIHPPLQPLWRLWICDNYWNFCCYKYMCYHLFSCRSTFLSRRSLFIGWRFHQWRTTSTGDSTPSVSRIPWR